MKKSKFTLIEMLITIAIIAILAAMLLPALHSARDMALISSCSNNTKNIGTMQQMYGDDWDNFLTIHKSYSNENVGSSKWGFTAEGLEFCLASYLNKPGTITTPTVGDEVFICPNASITWDAAIGKYRHNSTSTTYNAYEGSTNLYNSSPLGRNPKYGWNILRRNNFSKPSRNPTQWCSSRGSPALPDGVPTGYCGASWHADDFGPRPTVFLDLHVAVLRDPRYTQRLGKDIMTDHPGGQSNNMDWWLSEF